MLESFLIVQIGKFFASSDQSGPNHVSSASMGSPASFQSFASQIAADGSFSPSLVKLSIDAFNALVANSIPVENQSVVRAS
jgi:hypothetical protein